MKQNNQYMRHSNIGQGTVWCHYNTVSFLKNIHKELLTH